MRLSLPSSVQGFFRTANTLEASQFRPNDAKYDQADNHGVEELSGVSEVEA